MKLFTLVLGATMLFTQISLAANCSADPVNSRHGITIIGEYGSDSRGLLRQIKTKLTTQVRDIKDQIGKTVGKEYIQNISQESANSREWPNDGCRVTVKEQIYCSEGKSTSCSLICNTEKTCIDPR